MIKVDIYGFVMRRLARIATYEGYHTVADGAGIPISTLRKIKRREIADPGVSSVQKLAKFFLKNPIRREWRYHIPVAERYEEKRRAGTAF